MVVLICGNINSGKSTAIEKLKNLLPSYDVISIDQMRKQYGDGTTDGETLARNEFIKTVVKSKNALVELSGMGAVGIELEKSLAPKTFIILQINEKPETCIARIKDKDFSKTPYPKYDESLPDTIKRIDKEITNGELKRLWQNKALQIIDIDKQEDLFTIPLTHYEKFIAVLSVLLPNEKIKEIVSYGSLGRKELTLQSDIDCSVTTDYTACEVAEIIAKATSPSFIDTTNNMVTAYYDDILIEIAVVKRITDNSLFYAASYIKGIQTTIIKGSKTTLDKLQKITNGYKPDITHETDETIKRLMYFVLSLERVARRNDDYKFFFHNNIIIHEIVRLKYLTNGEIKKQYLPPQALSFCDKNIMSKLVYSFGNDKEKHIENIKDIVSTVLKSIDKYDKYSAVLK